MTSDKPFLNETACKVHKNLNKRQRINASLHLANSWLADHSNLMSFMNFNAPLKKAKNNISKASTHSPAASWEK